jgi:hypothetical protein
MTWVQILFAASDHLLLTSILILISWALYAIPRRARKLPLPPGPRPDPFIGHLRMLPTLDEHRVYANWGEEYQSKT